LPIVRIDTKLVYFAHVPKCGGSAIEDYLQKRFGTLGFLDRTYRSIPEGLRWTRSSPQHIHAKAMERLLPAAFFAARFAVVRHPLDRMISVFRFQRDVHRDIPETVSFGEWLGTLHRQYQSNPFYLDNHFRPMADIVPEGTTLFRLEDGLSPVIAWLDELAGNSDGPREIHRDNTYEQRLKRGKLKRGLPPIVTEKERQQINDYCAADFGRFGYERAEV